MTDVVEQVAADAQNQNMSRLQQVKRERNLDQQMQRIERKLDEIIARMDKAKVTK